MKVVHCKYPHDVYIGRECYGFKESKWHNPFKRGRDGATKAEVIAKFEEWIRQQPELLSQLHELDGKTLGCWCSPDACHGDVLKKIRMEQKRESLMQF